MRLRRLLGTALAVAALGPAGEAAAATAEVGCTGTRGCTLHFAALRAQPGEENRVTATQVERGVRIRDEGAPVVAGEGCDRVDDHEVVCRDVTSMRAWLGDGNDAFSLITLPSRMSAFVHGGSGDDRLHAGGTLDGGGGRDVLRGSGGSDTLIDGDSVRSPDADVMDGSGGVDTVSYEGRRRAVVVDLVQYGRVGERGERDRALNIEGVIGGAGDDRLVARRPEGRGVRPVLRGERGDDVLIGSPAGDHILPGPGADRVDGRGGNDLMGLADGRGRRAPDVIRCGPGRDVLETPEAPDFIAASCERPDYFGPFLGVWFRGSTSTRPVLETTAECAHRRGCRYDVRIVARASGRPGSPRAGTPLARRTFSIRRRSLRIALRLTPAARAALRRARRLPVRAEVRWAVPTGRHAAAFNTELRLPD